MSTPFRYARIGYAALAVADLPAATAYYTDLIGLDLTHVSAQRACLRCSNDHHNLVLEPGAQAGLLRLGFQLESTAELALAREHFTRLGLSVAEVGEDERMALSQAETFRVREPVSGLVLEYYAEMTQLPRPFSQRLARIARLGHVLITVPEYERALASFTRDFGFRVSDHTPGHSAFLRCFPNPWHHSFGLTQGTTRALHHVNFMVSDIDDIGRAMNRLRKAGVEIVFGPGRHFSSGSIFLYFTGPDGMTMEYSFEMEQFPEVGARAPRMLERSPETSDLWGSTPARPLAPRGAIL
jgi:2,3-dihydroxy-p-cumate/2,3-dihydroxybenzoate 3,4-dioxygenase